MKKDIIISTIGCGLFIVLGLSLFLPGALKSKRCHGYTTGTVIAIDVQEGDSDSSETYLPLFQYTANGKTYEETWGIHTNVITYHTGQTVDLRYNLNNPSEFVIDRLGGLTDVNIFGCVISIFSLLAYILEIIKAFRYNH